MDKGEDLHDAAVREVLEETGVKTKFVSIAAIRESQNGPFETTDCYCVCVMQLDEDEYGDTGTSFRVLSHAAHGFVASLWSGTAEYR